MDLSFLLSSPSFKRENEDNEQGGVRTKKMKTKMKMKMKTKMKKKHILLRVHRSRCRPLHRNYI